MIYNHGEGWFVANSAACYFNCSWKFVQVFPDILAVNYAVPFVKKLSHVINWKANTSFRESKIVKCSSICHTNYVVEIFCELGELSHEFVIHATDSNENESSKPYVKE